LQEKHGTAPLHFFRLIPYSRYAFFMQKLSEKSLPRIQDEYLNALAGATAGMAASLLVCFHAYPAAYIFIFTLNTST
jgi:hypothetical protein